MFCKCRNRCISSHLHLISKKEGHGRFQPPLLRNTEPAVPSSSSVVLGESYSGNHLSIALLLQSTTAGVSVKGIRPSWKLWSWKLCSCPFGCWIRALSEYMHSCAKKGHIAVQQCLSKNGFRACPNHPVSICCLLLAEAVWFVSARKSSSRTTSTESKRW